MAKKDSANPGAERGAAEVVDGPLLDLTDAAVKRMIKLAKKRGFVTYAELNAVLPSEEVNSEQIEDILVDAERDGHQCHRERGARRCFARGIRRGRRGGRWRSYRGGAGEGGRPHVSSEPSDRTDDPVRMYLREMGSVELLSREGEIAIAKRIEAGREAMIAGLCESPLTFQAIIIWRDELNDSKVLLRDIIDLEATYAGPDGKNTPKIDMTAPGAAEALAAQQAPAIAPLDPPARLRPASEDGGLEPPIPEEIFDEEDDMENSVSLSAMEAELKPKVLETFERIASAYKKLRRLQDQNVVNKLKNETLTPSQERKYKTLKKEIVIYVKSLSLNPNRIEALVDQLYDINRRLIGHETRLLRLAEGSGVTGARIFSKITRIPSSTRNGFCGYRNSAAAAGRISLPAQRSRSRSCLRKFTGSRPRRALKYRNSAESSISFKRASERRVKPRRRWWRQTSAW